MAIPQICAVQIRQLSQKLFWLPSAHAATRAGRDAGEGRGRREGTKASQLRRSGSAEDVPTYIIKRFCTRKRLPETAHHVQQ